MAACREIEKSKSFKKIVEVILAVGNFINGGTRRGEAYGFRLVSITKLIDTKTTDNKTNLLQYIAALVKKKAPELLNFYEELASVSIACKGFFFFSFFSIFL